MRYDEAGFGICKTDIVRTPGPVFREYMDLQILSPFNAIFSLVLMPVNL